MKEKILGRSEDLWNTRPGRRPLPLQMVFVAGVIALVGLFSFGAGTYTFAQTIVDEWASVQAPKPPELKPVKIDDSKSTAHLVLDMVKQTCNNERWAHCVASVPNDQAFLLQAKSNKI